MRQLSPFLVCSHSLITPLIGTFQILRIINMHFSEVKIPVRNKLLEGSLSKCPEPGRIVLFSHGSGSSRKSPRNRLVAESLWQKGISTLLFDLLTEQESADFSLRFDIPLLTERLIGATLWVRTQPEIQDYRMGYFGASTGAAAALGAAAGRQDIVAVVSRGGRPDLVMNVLPSVHMPVLFIVGGRDEVIGALNKEAFDLLKHGLIGILKRRNIKTKHSMHQRFRDRREAGRLLASELKNEKGEETIVLGIPRGGIPVAAEIARALGCTPEVLLCKKIGHPVQKEYAIGAVNLSDAYLIPHKDVEAEYVDQEIVHIRQRLEEMKIKFNISKTTPLEKKTVILADDGMATGRTMMAAVRLIRKSKPRKLILAIPVASESALKLLRPEVDQLICLYQPDRFSGVGAFYEHFEEFADEDVIRELKTFEKSEV